jgi:hypothetical protein
MCAERMQRIIIAIILGFVMGTAATGMGEAGSSGLQIAFLTQLILIIMLLVGGLTGFCPSLAILRQILPPCDRGEK